MQLGLKNGDVSPPEELSLFHERSLKPLLSLQKEGVFYPEDLYQSEPL